MTGRRIAIWKSTPSLPNFCIIGAMRSGTTSLANYLRSHPDVFLPRPKELHFFDREDRDLDWYLAKFEAAGGKLAIGEATPNYLFSRSAIAGMSRLIPQCRLIAILRNPADRAYSHYWHDVARGKESRVFADVVRGELNRANSQYAAAPNYLARGLYVEQIDFVTSLYPVDRLKIFLFEDLAKHPRQTYQETCRYLGLREDFVPRDLGEPSNEYMVFRSIGLRQFSKRLPRQVRRLIGRVNSRADAYPPMEPAVRSLLNQYFASANEALSARLGRDLSGWNDAP